ncbi:MAG TPA: hypothetical protein VMU32_03450 [Solirubrobacteraceae bacterium]|nr:hypothetical protein [Solirubrobacteraceae bacterium]
MARPPMDDRRDGRAARDVRLDLTAFAWEALEDEAGSNGVSVAELVGFSVLYYLADRDSGRIARSLPAAVEEPTGNPLEKLLEGSGG